MREWQNTLWYLLLIGIIKTGCTSNVKHTKIGKPINKNLDLEQTYYAIGRNRKTIHIQDLKASCSHIRTGTTRTKTTTTQSTNDQQNYCDVMSENPKKCSTKTPCQKRTEVPLKSQSECERHTEKQNNNQSVAPHDYIRKVLIPNKNNHDNQENEEDEEDDEEIITKASATEMTLRSLFSPGNNNVEPTEENTLEANTTGKNNSSNKASIMKCTTSTESICEISTDTAPTCTSATQNLTTTNTADDQCNNNLTITLPSRKQEDGDTTTDKYKNTTLENVTETVECNKPTLPTFLKHFQTYGKYKQILMPMINETIKKKFNTTYSLKTSHRIKKENNTKSISLTNLLSFSDVAATKDGDLLNSTSQNKSDWMHLLKARLQEGNSEYDDKPIKSNSDSDKYLLKESTKSNIHKNSKLSSNYDEDFMNYFLTNKLHHNKGINTNIQNNDKFNSNELSHLINRKNLKDGKRKSFKKINYELPMPFIDEDKYKLVQDYDNDISSNKFNKFGYLIANFIKNLASNDEFSKSNNTNFELTKNNEGINMAEDENKNDATNTTASKLVESYNGQTTRYSKEPNIQILNITQVFNLYSKLIPIKKYLEAVHSSKMFSPVGKNINHYVKSNEKSPKNNFPTSFNEYKVLKELLQNYITNLTELNMLNNGNLNINENESESEIFTELSNRDLYNNPYVLTSRLSKTPPNEEHNREKTAKMKSLKIVNDQIINVLKEIIEKTVDNEVTESNNEQDDINTMKQLSPSWDDSHKIYY